LDIYYSVMISSTLWLALLCAALATADFLRPALHITPFNNAWLNDPNGLFVDADGLWHVYYQCKSSRFDLR
jgi:sucrose-6-phosphate hydrolase SacC (GH32 family)